MNAIEANEQALTKQRILATALNLFSENGYEGTSIRTLAKEADVNISAVNYHFENKSNLYYAVIRKCHEEMSTKIQAMAATKDIEPSELVGNIFDSFLEDGPKLVAIFKIFLSSSHEVFERLCSEEQFQGPPGAVEIASIFMQKHTQAKKEDVFFVVRSIFTALIHNAVMISSHGELDSKKISDFKCTKDEAREDIIRMTRILEQNLDH